MFRLRTASVTACGSAAWILVSLAFFALTGRVGAQTCSTDLVSKGIPIGTANGGSGQQYITANGRYVVFVSHASDLPGVPVPTLLYAKVYVYDMTTHTISLAFTGLSGQEINQDCNSPSITEDGRYVVFKSCGTNIVTASGTAYYCQQIYLADRTAGSVQLVSVNTSGGPALYGADNPVIAGNGQYIAFDSYSPDLVSGVNNFYTNVFVRNVVAGTTSLASTSGSGALAYSNCSQPSLSADGRYVCFASAASNFGGNGYTTQVFRKDRTTGALDLVSQNGSGSPANQNVSQPAISAGGGFVVFASPATNLVSGLSGAYRQVFMRNMSQTGVTLVSRSGADAPAAAESSSPTVSTDGQFVCFTSAATNLVAAPINGYSAIFVRNTNLGSVSMASVTPTNQAPTGNVGESQAYYSLLRSISDDGRYVAMLDNAVDLVTPDRNGTTDVVVRDRLAGTNTLITATGVLSHQSGNGHSYAPSVSSDAHKIVFVSLANDLTPGNVIARPLSAALFLRDDALSAVTSLALVNAPEAVSSPVISADGHWVAYEDSYDDRTSVRIGQLLGGTLTQVDSIESGFDGGSANAYRPAMSANGQVIAFDSDSDNFVVGDTNRHSDVFVYDRASGQRTIASTSPLGIPSNGDSFNASISADGRYVAFWSYASNLVTPDVNGNGADVFLADRTGHTLRKLSNPTAGDLGGSYNPAISGNGQFVAFESDATTLVPGDTNGVTDVFVVTLASGAVERVSLSAAGLQGNGASFQPAISNDGRFVVFHTVATNLTTDVVPGQVAVFVRDRQTHNTYLVSKSTSGAVGNGQSFEAVISADGKHVALASYSTNLGFDITPGTAQVYLRDESCLSASCPADFNGSGNVTVQDIFDFLAAWFAHLPSADFNHSGSVTVQDIFDFLAAWFKGC